MYDGSSKPPISSSKLILLMLVAVIMIMGVTVALNGGTSTPPEIEENNSTDNSTNSSDLQSENQTAVDYKLIGNNSFGTVTKSSGYGNPSSDIHAALILGVDAKQKSQNAIVPTLQSLSGLNYCYDVYVVDALSENNDTNTYNQSNLTVNDKSESLATEYVVPDVIKNNYNFTVDVHYADDSNSYVFVPSENTYTSNKVIESITNNTSVGRYTPESHKYTEHISEDIIGYEIPSIVYATRDYYNNGTSGEIASIIKAIDTFDFLGLFSSDSTVDDTDVTQSYTDSVTNDSSNNTDGYNTVTVSSNSSGNKEVN